MSYPAPAPFFDVDPYPGPVSVTCDNCGRRENDAALRLTWSTSVERGRTLHFCDVCSREHVRSMEGKLDREYW